LLLYILYFLNMLPYL